MTNNPIELLINLGVNDTTSKNNIKNYIDKLKLDNLDVTLTVEGSKLNNKVFSDMEKQIESLKKQVKDLNTQLGNIGKSGSSGTGNTFLSVGKDLKQTEKEIENFLKKQGYQNFEFKINANVTEGEKELKNFVATIKGANNEIKKLTFIPDVNGFKEVKEQLSSTNFKNYTDSFNGVINTLDDARRNAKITTEQFNDFKKQIDIINNTEIEENKVHAFNRLNDSVKDFVTSSSRFAKVSDDIDKALTSIIRSGILSAEKIESFSAKIESIKGDNLLSLDEKVVKLRQSLSLLDNQLDGVNFQNKLEKASINATRSVQNLESDFRRLINTYRKETKNIDLSPIENEIRALKNIPQFTSQADIDAYSNKINQAKANLKEFSSELITGARNSLTLGQSFSTALEKFSIWMGASTLFYGFFSVSREFLDIIIEIDTKMTDLAKVMSADTDLGSVFDQATISAEKFGKSISDTLDAYNEFAKQGYKEKDLGMLSDVALMASNVSGDLDVKESAEYLTGTLIQWDKKVTESKSILDAWNQLSNEYATSVRQIGDGHMVAASTAKSMNIEFDQLNSMIGVITASTRQSGKEVGRFIKNSLPRLVSQPAQDALSSLDISLIDENNNLRDVIEVYTEVANKIKNISEVEAIAVVEGLAGKEHISRMQVLLDDLAKTDSMYRKMYETSTNSAGSADEENARYMDSLQARINGARVEVEKLALAISNAFLTSGMVSFLEISGNLLNVFAKITESVGVLPILLGVIGIGLVNLNKGFANTTMSIMSKVKALMLSNKTTTEATVIQGRYTMALASTDAVTRKLTMSKTAYDTRLKASTVSTQSAIVANTALSTSYKTLMASTGAGLAFVVAGFALEKLINHIGESQRKSEDLAEANKQLLSTYEENQKEIDSLSNQYSQLNEKISSGDYDTDDLAKYRDIQNELGGILPDLVTGEDQYGNKLIISADSVKVKTELLKEQLEIQKQLNEEQAKSDLEDSMEINLNSINDAKATIEDRLKMLTNGLEGVLYQNLSSEFKIDFVDSEGNPLIKTVDDLSSMIETLKDKLAEAKTSGNKEDVKLLETQISSMERYFEMLQSDNTSIIESTSKLKSDYIDYANSIINENKNITDSNKEVASSFASELIKMSDSSNIESVKSAINNMFKFDESNPEVNGVFTSVIGEFEKLEDATADTFEEVYNNVAITLAKLPAELDGLKLSEKEISSIMDVLNARILNSNKLFEENKQAMKSSGKTLSDVTNELSTTTDSMESFNEEFDIAKANTKELADHIKDLVRAGQASTATSLLMGDAYEKVADEVSPLNKLLEDMAEGKSISAHEAMELIAQEEELANAISIENGQVIINKEAVEKLRDSKVSSYKDMLESVKTEQEAVVKATLAKLENYGLEIKAITNLVEAKKSLAELDELSALTSGMGGDKTVAGKNLNDAREQVSELTSLYEDIEGLQDLATEGLNDVGTSVEGLSESERKAKETTDALKESTDAYRLSLEKLNLELERMQAIQAKFPEYSNEYQDALKSEIELQKQSLELMKSQEGSLKSMTSLSSSSVGSLANSASSLSGTNTEQQIWNFFKSKGLSESATAGIMGNLRQESNLNSSSVASNGASGIAQWMGGRLTNLKNYASSIGKSWDDLSAQLEFLWHELNGGEATTKSILNKNGGISAFNNMSVKNASELFEKAFERSGGSAQSKRNAYAEEFFRKLSTGTDTVQEFSNSLTTTAKTIHGFSGAITSTYKDPNRSDNHRGIDIDGNTGDRIDATTRGRVIASGSASSQGYDASYGNLVVVQDEAGLKHIYAHLENAIAKVGDTIEAGTQIGTMGSTGNSTGSHLHYEVNLNGQPVDPTEYVTNAKNGLASVGNSINDVESELVSVQSSIIQQETLIAELQRKLLDAELSVYGRRNEIIDADLSKQDARLANVNVNSEEYNKILEYQTLLLQKKQKVNQDELDHINDLIANGNLSAIALDDMKDRTVALTTEMYALDQQLQAMAFEKLDLYNEKREAPQDNIEFIKSQMSMMDDDTEEYADSLNKIILSLQEIQSLNISQLADLENEIKSGKFTGEALENLQDQYKDLKVTVQNTNTEIQDTFYQQSEYAFKINDNAIDKTQDKLDFLDYQLGLLGDSDTDVKIKVSLYGEMKSGLNESIAQIDQGIQTVLAEREKAIARGDDTLDEYDAKFEEYIDQRRNQNSKLQSIYNDMQSVVENALSKVKDAESNAYSEASKAIDKALSESERRIEKFSDTIDNLGRKLETLDESDFNEKISITSQQLSQTRSMASQIIAEYDKVASTPVYNEEQQSQVESQLKSLKSQLADANSQIIQYTKSLEQTHFESLIYGADKASKEIDRLTGKLNRNLVSIEEGLLSGTDIDLSLDSFVGKTLDLSTLISDPLAERDTILQIQDIRSSSYGEQIREAEAFYEEMKAKAEEFQKVMLEEVKKFEENMIKLLEIQNEKKKKAEEDAQKDKEKTNKEAQTLEKTELEKHYQNLQSTMATAMKMYQQEYSSIWGNIVDDLKRQIAEIESLISNVDMTIPTPDAGGNGVEPAKYATGGTASGLSIVGDKYGRELLLYPDGTVGLSDDKDQLVNLPKGTQVIPNSETEKILKGQNVKKLGKLSAYANGTDFDINKVRTSKLFDDKSYYNSFEEFINEIKKNTDVMNKLSDTEKQNISNISDLLDVYTDERYASSKDEIKNSLLSIISPVSNSISDAFKKIEEEKLEKERQKLEDEKQDSSIKEQYWQLPQQTLRGEAKEYLKNYENLESYILKNLNNERPQQLQAYLSTASKLNKDFEGYWSEEELQKIEYLKNSIDKLQMGNFSLWNGIDSSKIVKDFKAFESSDIITDENGALKYKDKVVAGKTIKGEYVDFKDIKNLIKSNENLQFTLDETGKIYNIGLSELGKNVEKEKENGKDIDTGGSDKTNPTSPSVSYSKEYMERWTTHQANREIAQKEIDELQKQLDDLITNNGTEAEIKKLQDEILAKVQDKNYKDTEMILDGLKDLEEQRLQILIDKRKVLTDELQKGLANGSITEEGVQRLKDEIAGIDDELGSTQTNLKNIVQQRFELEQSAREKILNSIQKETDEAEFLLEINKSISPFDYSKSIPIMQDLYNNAVKYTTELQTQVDLIKEQMKEFEVGSYEWNQLNDKVKEYNQQIQQSLLTQQRQRKQLFEEQMNAQLKQIELQIFGGKTEEQARKELERKYELQDKYVDGLERELEVDKIIAYARTNGIQLTKEELALLNSKGKIEKKSLERLQKQLEIRELEQRLLNLNMEKNIQQLTKQADGTWDYAYVVDQNAIDEAEQQLREKKLDLIEFDQDTERQKEQDDLDAKSEFYQEMKDIVDGALNGEINSYTEFANRMNALNSTFLNGMSEATKNQWQSMFTSVQSNISNMKNAFNQYVIDIQLLAKQAEEALQKLMLAKEETEKLKDGVVSSKDTYSIDEFTKLSSSEKGRILNSDDSYIVYNGKKVVGKDVLTMTNSQLKEKYGFANGGITTSTGLHWLDGELGKPEIVLNPNDTSNFLKAIDITRNMMSKLNLFNPNSIAKNLIPQTSTTEQVFHISKLEFPSVTNSDEIQKAIKNLPNIAISKVRLNN